MVQNPNRAQNFADQIWQMTPITIIVETTQYKISKGWKLKQHKAASKISMSFHWFYIENP